MPLIHTSYKPPCYLKNKDFQTILSLTRKKPKIPYKRERIFTPDNDFIELDWSTVKSSKIAVLVPGLEGHSRKTNILNIANKLNILKWDVVVINYRGGSGVPNRLPRFYHYGETKDLDTVLKIKKIKDYKEIVLIGCSVGGNIVLKYAGEKGDSIDETITRIAAFSAPIEYKHNSIKVSKQAIYCNYFLSSYKKKIKAKHKLMPDIFPLSQLKNIKTLMDYDKQYVLPFFPEFKDLDDYYSKCGFVNVMKNITLPAYLIIAKDDPFFYLDSLDEVYKFAKISDKFYFEVTENGGHAAFLLNNKDSHHENQIIKFIVNNEL